MLRLDHIAIAVPGLPEAIERWSRDLGFTLAGTEDVVTSQTATAFLPVTSPTHTARVELVAPLDGAGPIAKHLENRGPGLHHLCFRTDDLEADVERLKAKGYRSTTDAPTPGAHGTKVIFLHPNSTGGVLIELAEYP